MYTCVNECSLPTIFAGAARPLGRPTARPAGRLAAYIYICIYIYVYICILIYISIFGIFVFYFCYIVGGLAGPPGPCGPRAWGGYHGERPSPGSCADAHVPRRGQWLFRPRRDNSKGNTIDIYIYIIQISKKSQNLKKMMNLTFL